MKKSMATASALSVALLAGPAVGLAAAQEDGRVYAKVTGYEPFSSDANQESFWEARYEVECTKFEKGKGPEGNLVSGKEWMLPSGIDFTAVIVKAGSGASTGGGDVDDATNTIFAEPPTGGQYVWADTNASSLDMSDGPDEGDKEISHVIWCAEPEETPTETKTPTPTPTPPETKTTTPTTKAVPTAVPAGEDTGPGSSSVVPLLGLTAVVAAAGAAAALRARARNV